ncbi:MAG: hypothetical protein HY314_03520 [Acidobacteria bacterium]|nr:hypothetical protein [Acidobacteriota bacterium]
MADHQGFFEAASGGTLFLDEHLLAALERAKGNRAVAARLLGIGRSTFYRRAASLGIKPER